MRPVAQSDGHDPPGLVDEAVPGVAAVIDDVDVAGEDTVRQPVVPHELPDVLHHVQLGTLRRQRQQRDVVRHRDLIREVPSGLVEQQHRMAARFHHGGDLSQVQAHRRAVAERQDERRAFTLPGTDRAEDVGRCRALVLRRRGAAAAWRPAAGDLVLLANPGLIREPDFYGLGGEVLRLGDGCQRGGPVFLNASMAPSACA